MPRWVSWRAAVLIPLVALLVFLPSLRNGFTGWDDTRYVTENPILTAPDGLARIWASRENEQYYPLTFTSFWLEHRLWGDAALGYHLTNVVLHAFNAILLLLLLRSLGLPRWTACAVCLLFAVHPVQTMTVAWIAERKNLLSCCLCLAALLAWVRFRRGHRERWYLACLAAFVAALLSKSAVLAMPLAVVALDRFLLGAPLRSSILRVVPMIGLAVLSSLVTVLYEQKFLTHMPPGSARPLIASAALWFYLFKLLLPIGLLPIYPRWDVSLTSAAWWLPLAGLIVVAVLLWRARRRLGGPVLYGIAHLVAFLLPMLGLVAYGNLALTYVSDHYLYLACIGPFLVLMSLLQRVRIARPHLAALVTTAVGVVVVLAAVRTVAYIPVFASGRALWSRTLAGNPDCYAALAGMGRVLEREDAWPEAADYYRRASEAMPDLPDARLDYAGALIRLGRYEQAERILLPLHAKQPNLAPATFRLARIAQRTRRIDQAVALYRQGLTVDPGNVQAHISLAAVYLGLARREDAAEHFRKALALQPDNPLAYLGLATCHRGRRHFDKAVETLRRGLQTAPDDVRLLNFLARILATSPDGTIRNGAEAIALAERACAATQGRSAETVDTLAAAYAEAGRWDQAVATARKAARLAQDAGNVWFAGVMQQRADQYERHEPLREVSITRGTR